MWAHHRTYATQMRTWLNTGRYKAAHRHRTLFDASYHTHLQHAPEQAAPSVRIPLLQESVQRLLPAQAVT